MPFESNTETGRISVMRDSRRVLVALVLFSQGGLATLRMIPPPFFSDSKGTMLGLSNGVSFVSEL